jgi:hypothetical protein
MLTAFMDAPAASTAQEPQPPVAAHHRRFFVADGDGGVVCESPSPKTIFCYTPGLARLESGRLVATTDLGGPGVKKGEPCGRIFTSDDHGRTWSQRATFPFNRYNLPNNERHRLQLHFSKNMVDWCFAGIVAMGATAGEGRHYASMTIDGDDLQVLSRSGDSRAKSAHDGNLITFHTVKNFRQLVY